jgi:hypothetical protein
MLLLIFLTSGSEALARVNPYHAPDLSNVTSILAINDASGVARANLVVVPELVPPPSVDSGAVEWTTSRILREVGKQAVDQPGHFLIGAAPIWASRCLVGVPWFGWVTTPILAYREWLQWPSNRWWDPPLDWAFLTLGAVAATWSRRPGWRLAGALAAIRQSVASELTVRSRMRNAG